MRSGTWLLGAGCGLELDVASYDGATGCVSGVWAGTPRRLTRIPVLCPIHGERSPSFPKLTPADGFQAADSASERAPEFPISPACGARTRQGDSGSPAPGP